MLSSKRQPPRRKHKTFFLWQGTVGWALGRVSAHKRSMCRVSAANRTRSQYAFAITSVNHWLTFIACAVWAKRTEHVHEPVSNKRCTKYRIHFGANNRANCRGKITPTAVVYSVHTLYIHIWILPLSAKLVHSELLLTHKLATVNLWLLIAAYEQSLICYRTRCKHSCIPGAYPRKHLLIPCPTNNVVGHILRRVSNKHMRPSLD